MAETRAAERVSAATVEAFDRAVDEADRQIAASLAIHAQAARERGCEQLIPAFEELAEKSRGPLVGQLFGVYAFGREPRSFAVAVPDPQKES